MVSLGMDCLDSSPSASTAVILVQTCIASRPTDEKRKESRSHRIAIDGRQTTFISRNSPNIHTRTPRGVRTTDADGDTYSTHSNCIHILFEAIFSFPTNWRDTSITGEKGALITTISLRANITMQLRYTIIACVVAALFFILPSESKPLRGESVINIHPATQEIPLVEKCK